MWRSPSSLFFIYTYIISAPTSPCKYIFMLIYTSITRPVSVTFTARYPHSFARWRHFQYFIRVTIIICFSWVRPLRCSLTKSSSRIDDYLIKVGERWNYSGKKYPCELAGMRERNLISANWLSDKRQQPESRDDANKNNGNFQKV